jgi:iron complex transport system substrate-binding protein
MQSDNIKLSKQLNRLGIKTKYIKIDKLDNIKLSILQLGKILNKEDKAKEIITSINNKLKKIKNITKNKKILFVIGENLSLEKRIFVAGNNLYFDDIIKESGNINAFQSKYMGQPILNYENIIAYNADIVILLAHARESKGLSKNDLLKPWKNIPISASKTNSIYIIDKEYAGIPSNRLIYFLDDFKDILNNFKKNN